MNIQSSFYLLILSFILPSPSLQDFKDSKCSDFIEKFPKYSCVEEKPLGSGASAIVFKVESNLENFVLKILPSPRSKSAQKELQSLQKLSSPFVIKLFEYKQDDEFLYEILEFAENGDLASYFLKNPEKFGSSKLTLEIFLKLLSAVEFLHKNDVIHADLKTENIILDKALNPKLIDFDISMQKLETSLGRGTLQYIDPVVLQNWKKVPTPFTEKMDIYSLGVILYFLSQQRFPFDGTDVQNQLELVKQNNYIFQKGTRKEIVQMVNSCLQMDPSQRMSIPELKEMTINTILNKRPEFLHRYFVASNAQPLDPEFFGKAFNRWDIIDDFSELIFVSLLAFVVIPLSIWGLTRYLKTHQEVQDTPVQQQLAGQEDPVPEQQNQVGNENFNGENAA